MSRIPPRIEQKQEPLAGFAADRVASNQIRPITENGITYTVIHQRPQDAHGHFVSQEILLKATDASGTVRWSTRFFHENFIPNLEIDVQEVYPVDLAFEGPWVVVKLEHYTANDRIFRMAKEDGALALRSAT